MACGAKTEDTQAQKDTIIDLMLEMLYNCVNETDKRWLCGLLDVIVETPASDHNALTEKVADAFIQMQERFKNYESDNRRYK